MRRTFFVLSWALAACSEAAPTPPRADAAADAPTSEVGPPDATSDAPDAPMCTGGAEAPVARGDSAGVVDPATGTMAIFGGDSGPTVMCIPAPAFRDDTWVYDPVCDRWREVTGETHPSARARAAFALDSRRRRMVLFGGRFRAGSSGNYTLLRDVWAFDLAAARWEQLMPGNTGPTARSNAAAAYDSVADELLVYGGSTSTSGLSFTPQGDVWALNLETLQWRRVAASGPPARLFHAAAVNGRRLFVVGGGDARAFTGPFLRDAWSLDLEAGSWTRVPLTGDTERLGGRISASLVPAGDGYVLLGGHDDGALGNRNDVLAIAADGAVSTLREGDSLQRAGAGFCDFPPDFAAEDMDSPERRSAFVAAVDPARQRAIVYGGKTDCGLANDVWAVGLTTGAWTVLRGTNDGLSCTRSGRSSCSSLCQ